MGCISEWKGGKAIRRCCIKLVIVEHHVGVSRHVVGALGEEGRGAY
jgi:hypothetical protein